MIIWPISANGSGIRRWISKLHGKNSDAVFGIKWTSKKVKVAPVVHIKATPV